MGIEPTNFFFRILDPKKYEKFRILDPKIYQFWIQNNTKFYQFWIQKNTKFYKIIRSHGINKLKKSQSPSKLKSYGEQMMDFLVYIRAKQIISIEIWKLGGRRLT